VLIMLRFSGANGSVEVEFNDFGIVTYICLMLNGLHLYWSLVDSCVYLYIPDCCHIPVDCSGECVNVLFDIAEWLIAYAYDVSVTVEPE